MNKNIMMYTISLSLMLIGGVTGMYYAWNKPYNLSIFLEIPWWVWLLLFVANIIEFIRKEHV